MMRLEDWPLIAGRYYIGNKNSCIAVCTLASIDLLEQFNKPEYLSKIAVVGKSVTENIGIEKMVQNIVTNPNIRFLILCGRESEGHFVGQGLKSLIANGVDGNGRIIGAKGPMPTVKNLTKEQIEIFRKQVKIVDLIGCENIEKIMNHVSDCEKNNPGAFNMSAELGVEEITASHDTEKEFVMDEKGYFIISIKPQNSEIVCEHYSRDKKLQYIIKGKSAEEICATITRLKLVSRTDHAAYLGRELQKAEIALKTHMSYEQEKMMVDLMKAVETFRDMIDGKTEQIEKSSVSKS